jgi:hypothetical protein
VFDPTLSLRIAVSLFRLTRRRIRTIGSTDWPNAEGTIHSTVAIADDLQGWVAEITYSYAALGEYYSGTYRRGFRLKKRAESFLEHFPSGARLPVRYKPEQPEKSAVLPSDMGLLLAGW